MAAEFWDRPDASALRKAIAQGKFVKRTNATTTYFFDLTRNLYFPTN
jgi:hypothetical protein